MPLERTRRVLTVGEPAIRQAVADWLRHHRGYPVAAEDVEIGGDARGRAVARASVEVTVKVKEKADADA